MRVGSSVAIAWLLACAAPASAQSIQAAATIQFDQGRLWMKQGKYPEACAAFEKSQQLDAQNGTLFNLAECDAHIGKLASAWLAYRELGQRDSNPGRSKEAIRRARELEKRLPRLLVRLGSPPPGLTVTINGKDSTSLVGIDSPVDLGRYRIRATAPGFAAFASTAAVAAEATTVTVRIVLVEEAAAAATTPSREPASGSEPAASRETPASREPAAKSDEPGAEAAEPEAGVAAPTAPEPEAGDEPRAPVSHRRRNAAIVAITGGGLVVAGLAFGLRARSDWSDAEAACPGHTCAGATDLQRGNALVDSARGNAAWSTGLVLGGAAAAAVGIYLIATTSRAAPATALRIAPTPGGASAVLGGRF